MQTWHKLAATPIETVPEARENLMSDLQTTEQNVLRAFARRTGWTHLMDVITELREGGYEPRKVIAGVRHLVARGLLRGFSAERPDYQLTDEGRKALVT
jgi:hypothetical protein